MEQRIQKLAQLIKHHQDRYYNAQPEISDREFDELWDELRSLAPNHPLLQQVGSDESAAFEKRAHVMPMNSQDKASDPEAFRRWAERTGHASFVVQYKLDGASIELQYVDGQFRHGVTRGDGSVGDDITRNVRRMRGVPPVLDEEFTGAVRGEVMMERSVHREHFADKANTRNAANGLMKRKDGVGSEYLRILCYDVFDPANFRRLAAERDKQAWLERHGFDTVPTETFDEVEEVIRYRDLVAEKRASLDVDIDGLVVKGPVADRDDIERARPQRQIAFKFSPEEAITVLREVEWSESGHLYTPVGIVDPVSLAGTTVRRASLVHPELIESMALQVGSEVVITKRGDIIPKIERLVRNPDNTRPIEYPERCNTCGSAVVNEGKRIYCPNPACPRRAFHRLQKWIDVLDVRDFGEALLRRLFDLELVREIADLYRITEDQLIELEGMGPHSSRKVLANLHEISEVSLATFVAGFDIEGIAQLKVQKAIDAGFDTLEKLRNASVAELADAEGIAAVTAEQLVAGLQATADQMDRLLAGGWVTIQAPAERESDSLEGRTFCFTGSLESMTRSEAERRIRAAGGQVRSSVTAELSFLVTNDPESGSSKARKARSLDVAIISEDEFLAMLGEGGEDSGATSAN